MKNDHNSIQTVGDFVQWGASRFDDAGLFFGHGSDNSWDESLVLVFYALSLPWDSDSDVLKKILSEEEKDSISELFDRRINEKIPAAYLTGEAWFAGFKFVVDSRVLIPRSPIAELVEAEFSPWLVKTPATILDLCAGSGCIGIACAHYFPGSRVTLSDISTDALTVAEKNIEIHQLSQRVVALESDLFDGLGKERDDLIVSIPPYVDAEDLASMPKEYHHEPAIGLASGFDGLDFTRRLLREAVDHLSEEGVLVVEVGNSWEALDDAFPEIPFMWLEFERGGHGVFLLTAEQLKTYQATFS